MGQDMLFPHVVRILVTFAAGVGLFSWMGQFMPTTLSFRFSAGVGPPSCAGEFFVIFAARIGNFSCTGKLLVTFAAREGLFSCTGEFLVTFAARVGPFSCVYQCMFSGMVEFLATFGTIVSPFLNWSFFGWKNRHLSPKAQVPSNMNLLHKVRWSLSHFCLCILPVQRCSWDFRCSL